MIYIVTNKKGGVGKSTFANQILPAYLFNKTNSKIKLIEIDDENNDNATFSKSDILDCGIIPTNNIKIIDEIFYDNEDTIIDIGGNKTATIFLNEMKKVDKFDNITWFIPLGAGEQDNINALETFNDIKKLDEAAKVIFILSRVTSSDIEWEFLNFFGNEFLNTSLAICNNINDIKYIPIKSNSIISNARYFNKTVYDLAANKVDFKQMALKEDDKEKRRKLVFLNRVKNEAIEYTNYLKNDVFVQLDKML